MTTIREKNRDLQCLALEIAILRQYNLTESVRLVREGHTNVPPPDRPRVLADLEARLGAMPPGLIENQRERLAPTAEACTVLVWLERVLRVALKKTGPLFMEVSLPTLLRQATGKKRKVLSFPERYHNVGEIIDGITAFRNAVLHGNIEGTINCSVERFYGDDYVGLIEELYEIVNHFADQLLNAPAP